MASDIGGQPAFDDVDEQPEGPIDQRVGWGSDVAAQMLRRLDIPFIALTPGASYRGLHDSLVNHLGNERPKMILCLHEEHAVAIAQGYAKARGEAIAVALHSNVGLMHASMAVFNAWCDRQPMMIIGATGPLDAAQRRPWIDWIHTSQDQAALIRHFIKWDDQPGSVDAVPESFLRGWQIAATAPAGPVYVCLDAALQESALSEPPPLPDPARFRPPPTPVPDSAGLDAAAQCLRQARRPLILFGRGQRTDEAWRARIALAERLGAAMLSDLKAGSMVPSDHPLHAAPPFNRPGADARRAISEADAILSLGWIDLGGALRQAELDATSPASIIHAGHDEHLHGGWGKEPGSLPAIDIHLFGDPDKAVAGLLSRLESAPARGAWFRPAPESRKGKGEASSLDLAAVAAALQNAAADRELTFASLARGWPVAASPHRHPLAYLGKDGGGGVGSGPGLTIGAALALRDSERIVVGVLGDGDCFMSINALWTAAHYRIPALFVVANNRSYYNDEVHQERVARTRSRNPANKWIGQAIDHPAPDFASLARAQGVAAAGPAKNRDELEKAMADAVATVGEGRPFLVDVHIGADLRRESAGARGGGRSA